MKNSVLYFIFATALALVVMLNCEEESAKSFDNFPVEVKVLIKFKEGQFSPEDYKHDLNEISSLPVRMVFKNYGPNGMESIFKNRYDANGKLKKNIAMSNFYF